MDPTARTHLDESEQKDIPTPAIVAFDRRITKHRVAVQVHFAMARAHQVLDNVRPARGAAPIAEPLGAHAALHNRVRIENTAVLARVIRQHELLQRASIFVFDVVVVVIVDAAEIVNGPVTAACNGGHGRDGAIIRDTGIVANVDERLRL